MALILGVICTVAYGFGEGWFGSTTRNSEAGDSEVSVGQPLNAASANEKVALDADANK